MAEEQKIETSVDDLIELVTSSNTPIYSDNEIRAMELGWKPKDKFEGSEGDWRSAKDFIERGEMIGKIRAQSKQIQNVEQALKHIAAQNTEQYTRGYNNALTNLKAEKRQALAEGDLVAAEDVADKIKALEIEGTKAIAAAQAPARAVTQEDPDHAPWVEKNQWYNNPVMQKFADALAISYINENKGQVSPDQVREYVSKTVREEFKHKLQVEAAPNPDGEGRSNRGSSGEQRLSKIESAMSEEERRIMNTMIKAAGMTKKEYLDQYSTNR